MIDEPVRSNRPQLLRVLAALGALLAAYPVVALITGLLLPWIRSAAEMRAAAESGGIGAVAVGGNVAIWPAAIVPSVIAGRLLARWCRLNGGWIRLLHRLHTATLLIAVGLAILVIGSLSAGVWVASGLRPGVVLTTMFVCFIGQFLFVGILLAAYAVRGPRDERPLDEIRAGRSRSWVLGVSAVVVAGLAAWLLVLPTASDTVQSPAGQPSPVTITIDDRVGAGTPNEIQWRTSAPAASFSVVLRDDTRAVVYGTATTVARVTVPADLAAKLVAGRQYTWTVTALDAKGEPLGTVTKSFGTGRR